MTGRVRAFSFKAATYFRNYSMDEATKQLTREFNTTKTLSDFIAMVTRLSFVVAFAQYFAVRSRSSGLNNFQTIEYFICSGVGWTLSVYFGFKINNIILAYYIREAVAHDQMALRLLLIVLNLVIYVSLVMGIGELTGTMAAATKTTSHAIITFSAN